MHLARCLSFVPPNMVGRRQALLALFLSMLFLNGCETVGYYYQSIHGHFSLLGDSRSINDLLQDIKNDTELQQKLELVLRVREFATDKLELPENNSYRSYASLDRSAVVWSVVATPEFSVSPKHWCYPVIGCASYRGYFDLEQAQMYANALSNDGLDVTIEPAAAYSTLGWFDDPLPSTVINWPESQLVGLIFHELAHQQLYVAGDSSFNEAFASMVEMVGVERWFSLSKDGAGTEQWQQRKHRKEEFYRLLLDTRSRLQQLYTGSLSVSEMRKRKATEFNKLRNDYLGLKKSWNGYAGFDHWFKRDLNNARLASVATYAQWVPAFLKLLKEAKGDLGKFYKDCEQLANLPLEQRRSRLEKLLQ